MDQQRKELIRLAMKEYLTREVKYPDCSIEDILKMLKPLWVMLEDKGLTTGLSYKAFVDHANTQAMLRQMQGIFGL